MTCTLHAVTSSVHLLQYRCTKTCNLFLLYIQIIKIQRRSARILGGMGKDNNNSADMDLMRSIHLSCNRSWAATNENAHGSHDSRYYVMTY